MEQFVVIRRIGVIPAEVFGIFENEDDARSFIDIQNDFDGSDYIITPFSPVKVKED